MTDFFQEIRTHFNVLLENDSLTLTLINPNITVETMQHIQHELNQINTLKQVEIVIIECPNFDDEHLTILASSIPQSVTDLSLDFTGCESLRGEGFLQLFENLDGMQLKKLHLDLGSVYDINDIVIEGLVMLLSNLNELTQFYLDLYEVDRITEDGYLLLAQGLSEMQNLTKLHLDLSANPSLTEDALQILFGGVYRHLTYFAFKIVDIEHIGGGSFFKFGESIAKMTNLQELILTISTFSQLNQKGVYKIFQGISKLEQVKKLELNFSNINMPEKMLTYLNLNPQLQEISLDISCNRLISFGDFLNFSTKVKKVPKIRLNLDFCSGISEDSLQELIEMIANQNKCVSLILSDRNYTPQFQGYAVQRLMNVRSLLTIQINSAKISKKLHKFQQFLQKKRQFVATCLQSRSLNLPESLTRSSVQQIFYCK